MAGAHNQTVQELIIAASFIPTVKQNPGAVPSRGLFEDSYLLKHPSRDMPDLCKASGPPVSNSQKPTVVQSHCL